MCFDPVIHLEISSCHAQGTGDIILTFYNDIEVKRRKIQLYAWFILNDILKTNDLTAIIVEYMRDLSRLDEAAVLCSRIFKNTSKIIWNTMSMLVISSIADSEETMPDFLFDYTEVHIVKKDKVKIHPFMEEIKTMIFTILNNETTTITRLPQVVDDDTDKVTGLIIHVVLTLLMTFPLLHVRVQSHHRQAFFDTCSTVLVKYNGPHELITTPFTTLCLGDVASLGVVDCHCCVEPEITPSLSCTIQ